MSDEVGIVPILLLLKRRGGGGGEGGGEGGGQERGVGIEAEIMRPHIFAPPEHDIRLNVEHFKVSI